MSRNSFLLIVLFTAIPVWAQNSYPSTVPMGQPFSPQLRADEPHSFGQPPAPASQAYPTTGVQNSASESTQYEYHVVPPAPVVAPQTFAELFRESAWYSRIDYFHWNEQLDGADFVNEYGTLVTLGYENRVAIQRYRGELFGATMKYVGASQSPGLPDIPLRSNTKYLGFRLEYELLIEPEWLPQVSFFAGLGTRFWIRDMPDDFDANGDPVSGYQETWWTIYPYIGIEKRRTHEEGIEFYYSARIGCTPVTYQRVEDFETTLYPQCGLTGKLEAGVRGRRFLLSAYFEAMGWTQSGEVRGSLQPASSFTTVGFEAGYCF